MITADEARKISTEVCTTTLKQELEGIEQQIKKAAESGANFCYIDGTIRPQVKTALQDHGFTVSFSSQYNEDYVTISWI